MVTVLFDADVEINRTHTIKGNTLKRKTAVLALAIFTSVTLFTAVNSGFSKAPSGKFEAMNDRVEKATKNYAEGLLSENVGVVESSIQRIAKMKLQIPTANTEELQKQLNRLSFAHPSATVRYKAYIASNICADPEWFAMEKSLVDVDEHEFFVHAAQRLQQRVFGSSSF